MGIINLDDDLFFMTAIIKSPAWLSSSPVSSSSPYLTYYDYLFAIVIVTIIITRPKPAYGRQGLAGGSLRASGAQLGSGKWWFFVTNRHFIIINISSLSPLPPDLWHGANSLGEGKSALTGHVDHLLKRETPAISSWHWPSRQLFVFLFNNNNIWHQLISTSTGNPT